MQVHEFKTLNPFFEDVWNGLKDFEVRRNDRNFKVGDRLKLVEHCESNSSVPRFILKDVKYILKGGLYGIADGYVVLGLMNVR